jgi:hypothetical protein
VTSRNQIAAFVLLLYGVIALHPKAHADLPLYKVIPAARNSELAPAVSGKRDYRSWSRSHADATNPLRHYSRDPVPSLADGPSKVVYYAGLPRIE